MIRYYKFSQLVLVFTISLGLISCSSIKNNQKPKILISAVSYGKGVKKETLPESKVYAAMTLISKMTNSYELIQMNERDSLINLMKQNNEVLNSFSLAKKAGAEEIALIKIDMFKNMFRSEYISVFTQDSSNKNIGEGYCLLNFRDVENEQALIDPSLLSSLQRAYAAAKKDTNMFSKMEGSFKVKPAPTLAITGVEFVSEKELREWDIYTKKVVNSYALAESIFEMAKDCPEFVVYDIDTRDSIYNLFNMYSVENYNPISHLEIRALNKFSVKYIISGTLTRNPQGAELFIGLYKLGENRLELIKSVSDLINEDNQKKLEELTKNLTKKLLFD